MGTRLKWLTLKSTSASADAIPEDIRFDFKKPFITASFILAYSIGEHGELVARAELTAKIPIKGNIRYSVEAQTHKPLDKNFAVSKIIERDEVGGYYRKISAANNAISVEKSDGTKRSSELTKVPAAPLLAHLLAFPALQQCRDKNTTTYAAILVNGSRFQALRLDRVSESGTIEKYRGSLISLNEVVTEEEWLSLAWENATSFDFNFDTVKGTLKSASLKLPLVGKVEIK